MLPSVKKKKKNAKNYHPSANHVCLHLRNNHTLSHVKNPIFYKTWLLSVSIAMRIAA